MRIFLADPTENVIDLVAAKFSREGKGYPESYLCCLKERLILLGVGYIVVFIQIVIIPRELRYKYIVAKRFGNNVFNSKCFS